MLPWSASTGPLPSANVSDSSGESTFIQRHHTAPQSQKAVSAYFSSKQILPFGFARHYRRASATTPNSLDYLDWRECGDNVQKGMAGGHHNPPPCQTGAYIRARGTYSLYTGQQLTKSCLLAWCCYLCQHQDVGSSWRWRCKYYSISSELVIFANFVKIKIKIVIKPDE